MALLHKPGQTIAEISPVFTKPNRTAFEYIDAFFREIGLKSLGGQPFDWNRVEIKEIRFIIFLLFPAVSVGSIF